EADVARPGGASVLDGSAAAGGELSRCLAVRHAGPDSRGVAPRAAASRAEAGDVGILARSGCQVATTAVTRHARQALRALPRAGHARVVTFAAGKREEEGQVLAETILALVLAIR